MLDVRNGEESRQEAGPAIARDSAHPDLDRLLALDAVMGAGFDSDLDAIVFQRGPPGGIGSIEASNPETKGGLILARHQSIDGQQHQDEDGDDRGADDRDVQALIAQRKADDHGEDHERGVEGVPDRGPESDDGQGAEECECRGEVRSDGHGGHGDQRRRFLPSQRQRF